MQFEQLRTSMVNNANEDPSLYMAICLMESLINDVEEESGTNFEKCEIGNEMLPIKLLWLCRTINKVYKEQHEAFTRSKGKLPDVMEQLNTVQEELVTYADSAKDLVDAKNALKDASKELDAAKSQAANARELQEQVRKLEEEAEELRRIDPDKERALIQDLESEIAEVRRKNDEFRTKEIEPREVQLSIVKAETEQKEKERSQLEQQCTDAQNQHDELILSIAESKKELEQLNKESAEQESRRNEWQQRVQDVEERRDHLKGEVKAQIEKLKALQTETEKLKQVDLPEKELLVNAETDRKNELEARLRKADEDIKNLQEQNTDLETKCTDKEKELRSTQERFDTLTADLNGKTEELQNLEGHIQELENKDVANKYETYLRQKEEKLRILKEQEEQSGLMETEIQELDQHLESEDRRYNELLESKEKKKAAEKGLQECIRELSAVVTPEYQRETDLLTEQYIQLEKTRTALCTTHEWLREVLGLSKPEDNNILAEDAGRTMIIIREKVENYRRELINCAKQLDDVQNLGGER